MKLNVFRAIGKIAEVSIRVGILKVCDTDSMSYARPQIAEVSIRVGILKDFV